MARVTQPLRDEHKELIPHIEHLRTVADGIDTAPPDSLAAAVDHICDFLSNHLIPHAEAEEKALYPAVAKAIGAPEATRTMAREHVEVRALADELLALREAAGTQAFAHEQVHDLRRLLYGLYALIKVHFAEEEEVYLPILDERLSEEEAKAMFEAMGHAAHDAKEHAGAH
ncbi:MAG TPA: hemerythrin domain-containing protein [Dehalococcoidia bacterium]|jgi:hemerythrin-like domain-containing protein|nr:hemerythrin domain-containing protein [Dehalococcoidia bacterium]